MVPGTNPQAVAGVEVTHLPVRHVTNCEAAAQPNIGVRVLDSGTTRQLAHCPPRADVFAVAVAFARGQHMAVDRHRLAVMSHTDQRSQCIMAETDGDGSTVGVAGFPYA